ncbi:MAG: glycerol-3-phosphate 1-O-acyltransferase PlsY [Planctomycetales bacterium]|nr:glycerol-3-phosphate 1-O-acyltransferase PlsY [Planctomycetales bacterium]
MVSLTVLCCLVAFVVGGIPFGYLVGRAILKDDIRKHGSGNIGATNVARVIGWKWGSFVLVLDAIKGLLPTLGARLLMASRFSEDAAQTATILAGIAAILGHMYPIWLKLRGGKGVATALGVVLVISPVASLVALILFSIVVGTTKIVAAASIAAAIGFAVTQLILLGSQVFDVAKLPLTLFSVIVPALIVWKHRSNIGRILRGEENRIGKRSQPSSITSSETPGIKG